MTLIEAAGLLGVTAATLRQQIANGKLRARKVGRDWTVTHREVARYRKESRRVLPRPIFVCRGCRRELLFSGWVRCPSCGSSDLGSP